MLASKIVAHLDSIAPPSAALENDLVGFVIGDLNKEIRTIGVAWSPTVPILDRAVSENVALMVVHEPLFYEEGGTYFPGIEFFEKTPNYQRLKKLFERDMCVYVAGSNLDETKGGTSYVLANTLDMKVTGQVKLGRIGTIEKKTMKELVSSLQETFDSRIQVVGDPKDTKKRFTKIGCFAANGLGSVDVIEEFYLKGAEVLVSYGLTDTGAAYAHELGMSVISLERKAVEIPVMQALAEKLEADFKGVTIKFFEHEDPIVKA